MRVIGIKKVSLKRVKLPGDIRHRLESPRVFERAQSIKRLGNLSEPMIRQSDYKIAYGRDRIAAMLLLGQTEAEVKLIDCTDEELAEIELAENAQRRHNHAEERDAQRRLLEIYETMVAEEPKAINPAQRGKAEVQRGVKRLAREKLARETGVSPDTIKKRMQRDRRLKRLKARRHEEVTGEPMPLDLSDFETIGMEIGEDFQRQVLQIIRHLGDLQSRLVGLRAALSILLKSQLPLPRAKLSRALEDISMLTALMRGSKPVALCPFCKGLPGFQERCTGCVQTGWICADQAPHVPDELWAQGVNAVISEQGRYRRVLEVLAELQEPETSALQHLQAVEEQA